LVHRNKAVHRSNQDAVEPALPGHRHRTGGG
jgi:hypothetical protein